MATVLVPNDIVRARTIAHIAVPNSQVGINVMHYLVTNVVGTPTDQDCADQIDAFAGTFLRPMMSVQAFYRQSGVQVLRSPMPVEAIAFVNNGNGTGGALLSPPQLCGLVSVRTDLAGRANRGRHYLPFPPQGFQDTNGVPTNTYEVAMGMWAGAFLTIIPVISGGSSCNLVPIIKHKNPVPFPYTLITGTRVSTGFATQRRRGFFGKQNP